ncbi:uncharacterized protein DS421_18g617790 [Arachis hypogaea]|nr:uncharacterized protein DS421_18g617790 [Arachis hypogaea]
MPEMATSPHLINSIVFDAHLGWEELPAEAEALSVEESPNLRLGSGGAPHGVVQPTQVFPAQPGRVPPPHDHLPPHQMAQKRCQARRDVTAGSDHQL